jgi:transposase
MSSLPKGIIKCLSRGTDYLYESKGYRDKDDLGKNGYGKVKNTRKCVGRIDKASGEPFFHDEYLERMRLAGIPVTVSAAQKMFSENDIANSSVKSYGLFYFLKSIAERIGLLSCIRNSFPECWEEIYTLAEHLVSNGDPFMYCQEWLEETVSLDCGSLSSQRISELLSKIPYAGREDFYRQWSAKVTENDYVALDVTSESSYSELIPEVEFGYNRDGDDLPQVNLCMLFGENSRLPVYQTTYSGSLKDVSTLEMTLAKFNAIAENQHITAIMDKGFYSKKNVDLMLSKRQKFLMAAPFSANIIKQQVDAVRGYIDGYHNAIQLGSEVLYGASREIKWNKESDLTAHIFYSAKRAAGSQDGLILSIKEMEKNAKKNPEKYSQDKKYKEIIEFVKVDDSHYDVTVRDEVVATMRKYSGWLVILTNREMTAKEAISVYRAKDVVEKGFDKLKNSLDLGRLRVHSSENAQNKVFIGFISLILLSEIHKTMSDKKLYDKNFTIKKLMRILAKQKLHTVRTENGSSRILTPQTSEQKIILEAFNVECTLLL